MLELPIKYDKSSASFVDAKHSPKYPILCYNGPFYVELVGHPLDSITFHGSKDARLNKAWGTCGPATRTNNSTKYMFCFIRIINL